ncbi:hypothetical protein ACHAL6_00385 [Proteiniclasticum sp. C24MP]|uniref:hypothetical protein n=1 Tax=Proteiniclasticum sp. C24MP TaxID=3374101 RepID=UPI0037543833
MNNQIRHEIRELLDYFQEGYIQRDISKADSFMEKLFDQNENIVLIGTSSGEWCMGFDEVKELFISDWKYWGDMRMNADEAEMIIFGETAIVYTTGSVKYSFSSDKDAYSGYLGYIRECFDGVSLDSKRPDWMKVTDINWALAHILSQWEDKVRDYLWDLRISFILTQNKGVWKIRQLQFSLPVVGHLPDVRLDEYGYDQKIFDQETRKLEKYAEHNASMDEKDIQSVIHDFGEDYLDKETDPSTIREKYFSSEDLLVIDTDQSQYMDPEGIDSMIRKHRSCFEGFELNHDNCLVNSSHDAIWIATHGVFRKVITESEALEHLVAFIKKTESSQMDDKDKLFRIRRSIAEMLKENARGEEYKWPFRFEAVLVKENGKWLFRYLQFSLPFNYILEGKTGAVALL